MITSIVSVAKGSWRWQDAFVVAGYRPTINKGNGQVVLRSVIHSRKYSSPQLRKAGLNAEIKFRGSLQFARPHITVVDDYGNLIGAYHGDRYSEAL